MKAAILSEDDLPADPTLLFDGMFALVQHSLKRLYALGDPPDYEPTPDRTVAAIAEARGEDPLSTLYDLMLEQDATAMLMLPLFNYADGNHDAIREMMLHPAGVLGLSDGGAHCGMICDASYPTFLLTHWARDRQRGEKLSLEHVIRKQSRDTADLFGLTDRGTIERGQEGRHQRHRHECADVAPGRDGLGPAGGRKPDPAGSQRLRRRRSSAAR